MTDKWTIETEEQLVALLGEPSPMTAAKIDSELDEVSRDFINASPLVFVATSDKEGNLDVSPKGDPAGFCHIVDNQTLLLPERPGNKLSFGFRNIIAHGKIGLIFLLPKVRETLRINGRAKLTRDPAILEKLSAQGRPALLATQIKIDECFMHCGKALIRSKLWQRDNWIEPPDLSFGRQVRAKSAKLGIEKKDVEELVTVVDDMIEKDYVEGLY